jgi:hypothetical protein
MTCAEKLAKIKTLLRVTGSEIDAELTTYIDLSTAEILSWIEAQANVTEVPAKYETVQIFAVVAGYGISGAEGQTAHSENGISRTFKYADMVDYIRAHISVCKVIGDASAESE